MARARETLFSLEATPTATVSPAVYAVPGKTPIPANASNIGACASMTSVASFTAVTNTCHRRSMPGFRRDVGTEERWRHK